MNPASSISIHHLDNGLVLVGQAMPWLESVAFSLNIPAGCRYDPQNQIGLANFVCEMVQRGCGELSSREFIEQLELKGITYGASVGVRHTHFGGAMPAAVLHEAILVFSDVVRNPHLPEDQLEEGRQVCFQEIWALEDDLAQQTMNDLKLLHYGDPGGRNCEGTIDSVESIDIGQIREFFQNIYRPNGTVLGVAGNFEWAKLVDHVESVFGDWEQKPEPAIDNLPGERGSHHIDFQSNQTHIGLAWPFPRFADDEWYKARCAIGVLSDGMSSRLFREVRERRGLCYSVHASCYSTPDQGCVIGYCGTGSDRAQESLDVIVAEVNRLRDGVTTDELEKLQVQVRSGLIMSQESSRARAGTLATDWLHLGRARTLDEVNDAFTSVTATDVNDFLKNLPPFEFDLVTLGEAPLRLPTS